MENESKSFAQKLIDDSLSPVEDCCLALNELCNNHLVRLYNSFEKRLFNNIDFQKVQGRMPLWIMQAGLSPESSKTVELFNLYRTKANHKIFNLFIYYYDICQNISAIQDRIQAVTHLMRELYKHIPCKSRYSSDVYTRAIRYISDHDLEIHILINNIFVAYASAFDLLAKIAHEQFNLNTYNFSSYKNKISRNTLYKFNSPYVAPSLKREGLLFSDPLVVKKICTFRNEFVHNGPWDYRLCVYQTFIDEKEGDIIVFSPDMDNEGNFIRIGARNKFYSQGNRINVLLPEMIKEVTLIFQSTVEELIKLFSLEAPNELNESLTDEYLSVIDGFWNYFTDYFKEKTEKGAVFNYEDLQSISSKL